MAHLEGHERFTFVRTDVSESVEVGGGRQDRRRVQPGQPGLAAGLPGPPARDAGRRAARAPAACSSWPGHHGARFLMASTSEIYGDPEVHPQVESYRGNVDPTGPRSVYDEAKRFAESLTMAMHRTYGVDVGIARIFNTYGPRLAPGDGRVVSNFISQALRGEPLTVYGDGTPDPEPVLRRRRGGRADRPARLEPHRPGQHRQPRRAHRLRVGHPRARGDRARARPSSRCPCPSTTPPGAAPTSPWPSPSWAGSRPPSCVTAWRPPSRILRPGCADHDRSQRRRQRRRRGSRRATG